MLIKFFNFFTKKIFIVISALFFVLIPTVSLKAAYPVDVYVDFESGTNGNLTSISDMDNGTHGASWGLSGSTSHMFVSTTGQYTLSTPIQVGSTVYTDTGTRGFKFDPEGTTDANAYHFVFPEPFPTNASFGSYFMSTSVTNTGLSIVEGISGGGDYVVSHWTGSGSGGALHIKDGDTGSIPISPGVWYWITGVYRAGGTNELYVFDASTGLLVGNTSVASVGTAAQLFAIGRSGTDGTAGVGQWYWDNVIVSYSGIFPLAPFTPKAIAPTYDNDTGTYDNSVTVTISDATPSSSTYYCMDTSGTCTPSTLYTGPISINSDGIHLRSVAKRTDWTDSAIKDATYTINKWRGPTYVQSCSQAYDSASCTLPGNVTAQNAIGVLVTWSGSATLTSITDNCGTSGGASNTYTTKVSTSNYNKGAVGYTLIGASKSCTIGANFSGSPSETTIVAHEVTNVNQSTPVVSSQYGINYQWAAGTATDAVTSPSITTTQTNTLIFAATEGIDGGGFTAGTGYIAKNSLTKYGVYSILSEQKNFTSAGSTVATFTAANGAEANLTGIIAFQHPDVYYISGVISGLTGTISLQNNGVDSMSTSANGDFTFSTMLANSSSYNVTITSQPSGQTCVVSNGSGTVSSSDVTNISIVCASNSTSVTSFNLSSPSVTGTVNNSSHTVALTVPFGTSVTNLTPTIVLATGATVSPNTNIAQDFTNPVTYTVTAEDGVTTQAYVVTVSVASSLGLPTATSVSVSGNTNVGDVLTGSYTFSDPNGLSESGTTYAWLSSSASSGTYTEISGATSTTYTLTSSDEGKYIKFQVTPHSASGTGSAALSSATNQVPVTVTPVVTSQVVQSNGAPVGSIIVLPNYVKPRPQIIYPDGHVVYLDVANATSTQTQSTPQVSNIASTTVYTFTRNLSLYAVGQDVKNLQKFLNAKGFTVSTTGAGSVNKETNFFGMLTYKALVKFQKSVGLPSTGFFGPLTRAYILNN